MRPPELVSISHSRFLQAWCQQQIERELADLFTSEAIVRDDAGFARVSTALQRITLPFMEQAGTDVR